MPPAERKAEIDSLKDSPELDRLYDDIRTEVSRDLRHFRAREEQLSAMAPDELLMMYMNWKFRQIHPHPRKVLLSSELLNRKQTNDALLKPVEKQFGVTTRNGNFSKLRPCQGHPIKRKRTRIRLQPVLRDD
jgi:hypothetical protein